MKTHNRIFCAQLICAALVAVLPIPAFAQTPTADAKAEGKAFGREKAKAAQDAATTTPDAQSLPNFDANPSQTVMYDNPDAMAPSASAQASSHEGYRTMRSSQTSRARFAPVDLDATIARAQASNDDPLNYTSGMAVSGTQGRCVPLPGSTASNGRYMTTCNTGYSATQITKSCQIPLEVSVTPTSAYTYWCSFTGTDRFNRVDDCALFENQSCTETGTRPGVCLQWEIGPLRERYCIEPGEPVSILSCPSQVPGATLRATTMQNSVTAVRNESQCLGLASDSNCTQGAEACTDSDPETRIVNGVLVTQPCWAWERRYTCSEFTSAQDCETLEATAGCNLVREDCLTDEPCRTWERVYDCPLPDAPQSSNQFICDADVYCIDGSCESIEREANDEFKDAVVALEAMAQANREFDPNTLTLFKGERGTCSSKVFGVLNCCKGKGFPLIPGISLLVALGCNAQELLLHERDAKGLCAYVGSYCSDSFLGVCAPAGGQQGKRQECQRVSTKTPHPVRTCEDRVRRSIIPLNHHWRVGYWPFCDLRNSENKQRHLRKPTFEDRPPFQSPNCQCRHKALTSYLIMNQHLQIRLWHPNSTDFDRQRNRKDWKQVYYTTLAVMRLNFI